uniref:Testis expressed 36 n=1 Tax=Phasianus colchicus TaxID=9054 RepID=A0A669PSI4_PHACC
MATGVLVLEGERLRAARAGSRRRAMPKGRWPNRNTESAGTWFAHVGECQGQLESTTHSAQRQGQDLQAARSAEDRLPAVFRAREQSAVNNNFPFSSHDNRHCLQNVGEYFDFGLGRRKVEPQRRQQNSQNFFQWASESVRRSEDGLTIYQTSFVKGSTQSTSQKNLALTKPVPQNENNVQPNKSS